MPQPNKDTPVRFGLRDRVVVITGAAHGIGLACAERLADEGARLVLLDIDDDAGHAVQQRLCALNAAAFYQQCDVGDKAQVDAAVAAAVQRFGRIDVLVNNAGIFRAADFLDITEADFDAVLRVNLKGAFLMGQACARQMVRQGQGGAIINMSSVNGVMAIPSIASYNVSKGGIDQLTRVMALALADHGIRVNAVAPGTIATELARQAVLGSEDARQRILSRTPMKRLGEPQEVADAVLYLASPAASYITGEILYVDGGRRALNYTVAVPPSAG
ncbi:SDR family NAD(P)-dependent oxidoreductase [Caldimonas manganoxidans]|uniref:SDR family NAD(P)-dependent oxidoreductase n=1 Tax=Caldimonas manganoxidans TaxID=196015 RepID=UPI0003762471|nr:SDR family NAD(P)-dependent oxidoreductase [Caldimonas manganoxidans]